MKIRLIGLPADVDAAVTVLRAALDVASVSAPYPCRGQSREVRVFIDARPKEQPR